jgi:hypothetical protein
MFFRVLTATACRPGPCRGLDRAVGLDDDAAEVLADGAGGGVAGGDHLERQALGVASSSEIVLLKPNWYCPLTTAGTIAAPPWAVSR